MPIPNPVLHVALSLELLHITLESLNRVATPDTRARVEENVRAALRLSQAGPFRFTDLVAPSSLSLLHHSQLFEHATRVLKTSRATTWRGGRRVHADRAVEQHKSDKCVCCSTAPLHGNGPRVCVTTSKEAGGDTKACGVIRTPSPRPREADQVRAFELDLTSAPPLPTTCIQCVPKPDLYPDIRESSLSIGEVQSLEGDLARFAGMRGVVEAWNERGEHVERFATIEGPLMGSSLLTISLGEKFSKLALGAFDGFTVKVLVHRKNRSECMRRCFTFDHMSAGPWKSWGLPLNPEVTSPVASPLLWIPDPDGELELAVYRAAGRSVYQHGEILRPVWAGLIRRAHQLA